MKLRTLTTMLLVVCGSIAINANAKEKDVRVRGGKKSSKSSKKSANKKTTCKRKPSAPISALYTMTNNGDGNSIVVYERNVHTGLLKFQETVSTAGLGGRLGLPDGSLAPVGDPLASTNALIVAGTCLLAVNTGSNSVSSFSISSKGRLTLADQQSSDGEFPVSISEQDGLVYVLNAGLDGSISGFNLLQYNCNLNPIENSFVDLNLNTGLSSGELPFFAASPAQISVSPGGNFKVSLKGFGNNFATGSGGILTYTINKNNGKLVQKNEQTLSETTVPFSFDFTEDGTLLLVEAFGNKDPGTGDAGTITTVDGNGVQQRVKTTQSTTCWIKYSEATGCIYTTNNEGFSISSAQLRTSGKIILKEAVAAELGAPLDLVLSADNKYLYALASNDNTEGDDDGIPAVYAYDATNCDCGIKELQSINEGQPLEFTPEGNPTPGYNGIVGIALWQS